VPLSSEFDDLGEDDGERASILIVDDLPEKLLVFQTVLEDLGDVLDVLGLRHPVGRRLRRLVGVQRPLNGMQKGRSSRTGPRRGPTQSP